MASQVALRRPMTKLAHEAVGDLLGEMKFKEAEVFRAGTTLKDMFSEALICDVRMKKNEFNLIP